MVTVWFGVGQFLSGAMGQLYPAVTEQVIQQNMTMIFPMTITLIIGYIINREIRDDTLKNLITVPVKYSKYWVQNYCWDVFCP